MSLPAGRPGSGQAEACWGLCRAAHPVVTGVGDREQEGLGSSSCALRGLCTQCSRVPSVPSPEDLQVPFGSVLPVHRLLAADTGTAEVRMMSVLNVLRTTAGSSHFFPRRGLGAPGAGGVWAGGAVQAEAAFRAGVDV